MVKHLPLITILLAGLLLAGCQFSIPQLQPTQPETTVPVTTEATAPVFAEETAPALLEDAALFGYDFTGLTHDQAEKMFAGILSNYRLTLQVGQREFLFTGETLGLQYEPQVFYQWLAGNCSETLLSFQESAVHNAIEKALGEPVRDAAIYYNEIIGQFITDSARTGVGIRTGDAIDAVHQALLTLSPTASADYSTYIRLPGVTNSHSWITSAIDAANRYLALELTYTFANGSHTLTKAQLADLLSIDENFTVSVSEDSIRSFVSMMAAQQGAEAHTGTLDSHAVTCFATVIDQDAMAEHLTDCLKNLRSGSFAVPYIPAKDPDAPYGGNFVDVDLTNQQLSVYQDGKAVVTVPTVSGSVPNGDRTRGGIFSIYEKDTRCWLVGYDFRDYVNYWIAFNGNIGIHDASWRQDFGGSIYCYDGSHGCVNIPVSMAAAVYRNVSVGTRVIVHGGEVSAQTLAQTISGTESYTLATDAHPFRLDISVEHTGTQVIYETADPRVVTVSSTGLVTVIGPGQTQITVRAQGNSYLEAAEFTVDIAVN